MKLATKVVEFLKSVGQLDKKGNLVIPLAVLEESGPTRVRTSEADRTAKFLSVLETISPDEVGVRHVPAFALADAGLPEASVGNPAYWSGIADGSRMAHAAGYRSQFKQVRTPGTASYNLSIILTPLTDADRTAFEAKCTAADTKAAAAAAAKLAAAEAAKVGATSAVSEGAAVVEGATAE